MREERIRGDGLDLHVAVAGDGPPVILLHGFPESGHSWRHQIGPLAGAGFSVWVPNLRGYPPSDVPKERSACDLHHLVRDVVAIAAATGYPRAHVVGHDWGGIIAWAFAGAHPGLVNRLIIMNAPHMQLYAENVWCTSQVLRSWYVGFFQLPVLPEKVLAAGDYRAVRNMFSRLPARKESFGNDDIERYIGMLAQPGALKAALDYYRINLRPGGMAMARSARTDAETLVIWGMRDPALGSFLLEGLERFAPRLRIHCIQDASHWVQNEAPEEVNSVMLRFLSPARDRMAQAACG